MGYSPAVGVAALVPAPAPELVAAATAVVASAASAAFAEVAACSALLQGCWQSSYLAVWLRHVALRPSERCNFEPSDYSFGLLAAPATTAELAPFAAGSSVVHSYQPCLGQQPAGASAAGIEPAAAVVGTVVAGQG